MRFVQNYSLPSQLVQSSFGKMAALWEFIGYYAVCGNNHIKTIQRIRETFPFFTVIDQSCCIFCVAFYLGLPLAQQRERHNHKIFTFIFLLLFLSLSSWNHQRCHHHCLSQTHLISQYTTQTLGPAHWWFHTHLRSQLVEKHSLSLRQLKLNPERMQLFFFSVVHVLVALSAHHPGQSSRLVIEQFWCEGLGWLDGL